MNSSSHCHQESKREDLFTWLWAIALGLCSIFLGFCFAVRGLDSSDTCWLLALGRRMWETHQIAQSDPLSFTLPLAAAFGLPMAFQPRQWLFELLLYALYLAGKLPALIAACSALMACAFIVVPWQICARARAPGHYSCSLIVLAALTGATRASVRPEVCTFAFMSLWLFFLQYMRINAEGETTAPGKSGINWSLVAALAILQMIWCNTHSGFVLALAVLAIYCLSFIAQDLLWKKVTLGPAAKTAVAALVISSLATLINPVGTRLWTFLPVLLFSPINQTIVEMRHVEFADLGRVAFYPFFTLLAVALWSIVSLWRGKVKTSLSWRSPLGLASILLIAAAAIEALSCLRLMPVMAILLVCELATIVGRGAEQGHDESLCRALPPALGRLETASPSFLKKAIFLGRQILPPALAAVAALVFANRFVPLTLPQSSEQFHPPERALEYLRDHRPRGPLFNEAKIGSMITWYLPHIKVFLDTRFDQYGELLLRDYDNILYAQNNCRELLDTYGIDWVFVPKSAPIVAALAQKPAWSPLYADEEAVILVRSQTPNKAPTD